MASRLRVFVRCEGHQFLTLANGEDNFLQLQDVIESQVAQLYHVQTEIDRLCIDGYDIFPEFTVRDVLTDECVVMVITKEAAASKKRRYSINSDEPSPNPPPAKKSKPNGDVPAPPETKVEPVIDEDDSSMRKRSTRAAKKVIKKPEEPAEPEASEKEMFSCPYCSRESGTKGGLTRHIHHAHPGEVIPSHITRKQ